ncbi:hypothetical protein PHSC3_001034 [Chlamydiales bacterium STE3]|nr:hypothetical protein PHSC3_001034 [Chlamydiales bacterium STE3]
MRFFKTLMAYSLGLCLSCSLNAQELILDNSDQEQKPVVEVSQEDSFLAILEWIREQHASISIDSEQSMNYCSSELRNLTLDLSFIDEAIFARSKFSGYDGEPTNTHFYASIDDSYNNCLDHPQFRRRIALEISPSDSFLSTLEKIRLQQRDVYSNHEQGWSYCSSNEPEMLTLCFLDKVVVAKPGKQPKDLPRNYFAPLTQKEKEDISYIITTLANNNVVKIASHRSALKRAGDRVDHVHPFRFLQCIFTNEELKVGIRNIQGKNWIWSEFLEGITSSLKEETRKNNLRPEFLADFATILGIDVNIIYQSYLTNQWEEMVNILINSVPRKDPSDRYNI